jgi:hypothetical protein
MFAMSYCAMSLIAPCLLLRHVVLGVPKSTEGSGPVRFRSQNTMAQKTLAQKPWPKNLGPKTLAQETLAQETLAQETMPQDGQQIGPSFAKINWGDVAYKPRKPLRAPQWQPKTYPRLHVCHAFGSGMPIGDEFCPFDQNGG